MSKVILGHRKYELIGLRGKTIQTSLSLSADTSDHLNSACPPRVPPRIGSNMTELNRAWQKTMAFVYIRTKDSDVTRRNVVRDIVL